MLLVIHKIFEIVIEKNTIKTSAMYFQVREQNMHKTFADLRNARFTDGKVI